MLSPLNLCEAGGDLRRLVDDYERQLILSALAASGGQQNRAAALLGVLATTLHGKLRRLGIHQPGSDSVRAGAQTVTLGDRLQEFRWSGRLRRGSVLKITGMTGTVSAGVAEGDEVEVVAVASGRSVVGQAAVSVLEHDGGAMFAVYEARPGTPEPGSPANGLRVDFRVRVPEGVSLVVGMLPAEIAVPGRVSDGEAHMGGDQAKPAQARSSEGSVKGPMDPGTVYEYQPQAAR